MPRKYRVTYSEDPESETFYLIKVEGTEEITQSAVKYGEDGVREMATELISLLHGNKNGIELALTYVSKDDKHEHFYKLRMRGVAPQWYCPGCERWRVDIERG